MSYIYLVSVNCCVAFCERIRAVDQSRCSSPCRPFPRVSVVNATNFSFRTLESGPSFSFVEVAKPSVFFRSTIFDVPIASRRRHHPNELPAGITLVDDTPTEKVPEEAHFDRGHSLHWQQQVRRGYFVELVQIFEFDGYIIVRSCLQQAGIQIVDEEEEIVHDHCVLFWMDSGVLMETVMVR